MASAFIMLQSKLLQSAARIEPFAALKTAQRTFLPAPAAPAPSAACPQIRIAFGAQLEMPAQLNWQMTISPNKLFNYFGWQQPSVAFAAYAKSMAIILRAHIEQLCRENILRSG